MPLRDFYNPSVITDTYGTPRDGGIHTGIDYAYPEGTPIPALVPGKVTASSYDSRYGNYVDVEIGGQTLRYAHLQQASKLSVGDTILSGMTIGLVGQTGFTTGPHLHLEIRKDGGFLDPAGLVAQIIALPEWALEELNEKTLGLGGNIIDDILSAPGDIVNGITGAIGTAGSIINVFADVAKYSADLIKWLLTERHWWAILFGAGGLAMMGLGVGLYFNEQTMSAATLVVTKGMAGKKGATS